MSDPLVAKGGEAKFRPRSGGRRPLAFGEAVRRFWERSFPEPNTGCLLYGGNANQAGYGIVHIRGRRSFAHRFAYQLGNGPIPSGLVVCHRCDTPACINPDHLSLGTIADNNNDSLRKGRRRGRFSGTACCVHGHRFTPENTHIVSGETKRRCRTCWKAANARARAKRNRGVASHV
jgi:hypothetical protein